MYQVFNTLKQMHLQSATTKKSNISNVGSMLFPLYHLVN